MNERLKAKLDDIFSAVTTTGEGFPSTSFKNSGISELDLGHAGLSIALPDAYVDFLKYANGCTVFNVKDLDGFHFLGTADIGQENKALKGSYEEYWDDSITIFCTILGEGNYIGFRMSESKTYEILDCFHEYVPAQWEIISGSFDAFLEKLIDLKGEKFWLSK
jgi:hypothetical protein